MKKNYTKELTAIAALALFAPWANAQEVSIGGNNVSAVAGPGYVGPVIVEDTLTVEGADTSTATGTPPVASLPIGDAQNAGFQAVSGEPDLRFRFSTNGSGQVVENNNISGGVEITPDGNVTLEQSTTQVSNTNYTIEARDQIVSNPAGFTDVAGTFGPAGTFYPNGANLPGTTEFVATLRDGSGQLLTVLSDLPGVGTLDIDITDPLDPGYNPANFDGSGNPVLSPAQITAAEAALAGDPLLNDFVTSNPAVTDPDTGNLQVGGTANVNGVLSLADAGPDNELGTPDDGPVVVADVGAAITGNTSDIGSNATDIGSNATDIGSNATDIATNATNIGSNATDIGSNATDIATNSSNIATNSTNIAANATNIATNSTNIATNSSNIATNASNIATNSTNIASNNTNIVANDAAIQQEIDDRSALIRREADGFIHIGNNSMIYDDVSSSTSDRLTSSKSTLILGGGATTDILVDANLDVAGQANFQQDVSIAGDLFINGNDGVQAQLDGLDDRVDENARGIAMVAALQNSTVLPGMTHALDVGAAHFEGETGMSLNYSRRINENVQINFGAASTTDFEESVIRAGVGVQW